MALKRKRSDSNFSPVSTSSYTSTESRQSQSPIPAPRFSHSGPVNAHGLPSAGEQSYFPQYAWHLNSRTMKRHRDNRPDERVIYGKYPYAAPPPPEPQKLSPG
ncbi:hypothetical protein B0A49_02769 [Cryomyces minteri]|uniref:Uncharacterized protein n=1 Tax=Cryomyces minteri TaxID=331657 RepID=A0A4U0XK11_9PEZI|nr:hypothetical protein B0A49_02769 [Cryomyces minteri]